jgi:hypothetical protein
MFYVPRIFGCWWSIALLSFPPIGFAQVFEQKPNLHPLPAFDVDAGEVDPGSGKQKVNQRVYLDDGGSYDRVAGWFEWHSGHSHFPLQ